MDQQVICGVLFGDGRGLFERRTYQMQADSEPVLVMPLQHARSTDGCRPMRA